MHQCTVLYVHVAHHSTGGSPEESVEMMDSCLGGTPRVRENVEHMEVVALSTGSHKQVTTEAVTKKKVRIDWYQGEREREGENKRMPRPGIEPGTFRSSV